MKELYSILALGFFTPILASPAQVDTGYGADGKYDELFHIEKTIDAPVQEVWPYFTDMRQWIRNYEFVTVAGERDQEGEVTKLLPREDSPILPNPNTATHAKYYYRKTLQLVPFEKVVFKVFPPPGGAYGFEDITVFYVLLLKDMDGRQTHVVVDRYTEVEAPGMSRDQWLEFVRTGLKGSKDGWKANLDYVEQLVLGNPE